MHEIFTDTVTVYNYIKGQSESWQRTVVRGVMWKQSLIRSIVDKGLAIEKTTSITFPMPGIACDRAYTEPKVFAGLTTKEKARFWTLDSSHRLDVVLLGVIDKEISKDYSLSRLIKEHDAVCTLSAVTDNRGRRLLKHIKAVGR